MENSIDILWLLFCASLVFVMQAGFLGLETGYTRSKNNINVALKNIIDFAISTLIFLFISFGIIFGQGVFNPQAFLENPLLTAFFIFQAMFCGTTVTIISGAIAERTRFSSYIYISIFMTLLIYPVVGRWAWGGTLNIGPTGWLMALGFVDFAGSTVVHSVGGWAALALAIIIGPRIGRFLPDGTVNNFQGANIPFAALGLLLLFIGWIGFNGGSTFAFNQQTLLVIINTLAAGSAGLVTASLYSTYQTKQVRVDNVINGVLAGLVAITAGAHAVQPLTAVLIGAVGGLVMVVSTNLLFRFKIDDAVSAIPIHLGGGIWGTLAVGIFGNPQALGTGLSWAAQIGIQLLGIITIGFWTFGLFYLFFRVVNAYYPLRVPAEAEHDGLNIAEHNASTDLAALFQTMEMQARSNDLSLRAPVDPFTDVGQIASRYNTVLDSLEDAERSLEVVVNNSPVILFAVNSNGIFTVSEGKGLEQLGRKPKEVLGQSIYDVYKSQPSIIEAIQLALQGERVRTSIQLGEIAFDALYEPIVQDNHVIGVVGLANDITNRVKMEEALVVAHSKAKAASQFKSELLAKVSHELRTPLGIIMAYGEMLQHGIYGDLTDEQQDKSEQIVKNAAHLTEMVNDLLDQAQIEAGSIQLRPIRFSLRDLVQDIKIQMLVLAERKAVALDYWFDGDVPQTIWEDKLRLRQIMFNLLGNAIKFTEDGTIHLKVCLVSSTKWAFSIEDTGRGIPEEEQKAIFEPFKQVNDELEGNRKGSGLGLTITANLIELMGGELSLESEVGKGSTFTVTLPIKAETE